MTLFLPVLITLVAACLFAAWRLAREYRARRAFEAILIELLRRKRRPDASKS